MNIFFIKEASNYNRIIGLDVLRCLAIIMVLIAHGNRIIDIPFKGAGYFGVELFFVLSGYLIGAILIKVYENDVNLKSIINFWIRRWFRTLPNYYLFLMSNIIIASVAKFIPITPYIFKYFLFLQCFSYRSTPIMGESWSLCIEEWFYIIFPIWLFLFSLLISDRKRMILFSVLSFILLFTFFRMVVYFVSSDRSWDYGFRCTTLLRLDSIAYGVFWAWVNRFYKNQFLKYKHVLFILGSIGMILSALVLFHRFEFFNKTLIFSLTDISFSLVLPFFSDLRVDNYYIKYAISHISIVSYSIYLIHYSFVLTVLNQISFSPYIEYFLYWSLSIFMSTVIYNLYEKKMTSIRNKFSLKETNLSQRIASADA